MSNEFDPVLRAKNRSRKLERQAEHNEKKRKEYERGRLRKFIAINGSKTSVTRVVPTKSVPKRDVINDG